MIAAGFGFASAASTASLHDALRRAAAGRRVTLLCAPEDKARAACLLALAEELGLKVHPVPAAGLAAAPVLTRSARSLAARGTGSVAEASALAGAGPGARLLAPRAVSADRLATCALAATSPDPA